MRLVGLNRLSYRLQLELESFARVLFEHFKNEMIATVSAWLNALPSLVCVIVTARDSAVTEMHGKLIFHENLHLKDPDSK